LEESVLIELLDPTTGESVFQRPLSPEDTAEALNNPYGFEFTLVMAATKSYSAQLTFDDSNNDQAPATEVLRDIFSLKVGDECVIDIRNF
jgi:hypothetical protein